MKRTDLYASLRPHAEEMQVTLGEVLFYEGDRGDCFYYVLSGQLRVLTRDSNDEMQTLGYLFPGDHFGEGALLTGKPRRATVRAVEPSTVLKISQGRLSYSRIKVSGTDPCTCLNRYRISPIGTSQDS